MQAGSLWRFGAAFAVLVLLLTCYQLTGEAINGLLRRDQHPLIWLSLDSNLRSDSGTITADSVSVKVIAPPRAQVQLIANRVDVGRKNSSGGPLEFYDVPVRQGGNELVALLVPENSSLDAERAQLRIDAVSPTPRGRPVYVGPVADPSRDMDYYLVFLSPELYCAGRRENVFAPRNLGLGVCLAGIPRNAAASTLLLHGRRGQEEITLPPGETETRHAATEWYRQVRIDMKEDGSFMMEAKAFVPPDSVLAEWIRSRRIGPEEFFNIYFGLSLDAWFHREGVLRDEWMEMLPFQRWRPYGGESGNKLPATLILRESGALLSASGTLPSRGIQIQNNPSQEAIGIPFPLELQIQAARREQIDSPAGGHWDNNTFHVYTGGSRPPGEAVVTLRPFQDTKSVAATAERPVHFLDYVRDIEGIMPEYIRASLGALTAAIPFLWFLRIVDRVRLPFGFDRTLSAACIAFLFLHFAIRLGSALRFSLESLNLTNLTGSFLRLDTLGSYYPYLAVGAVLLLWPVYTAHRRLPAQATAPAPPTRITWVIVVGLLASAVAVVWMQRFLTGASTPNWKGVLLVVVGSLAVLVILWLCLWLTINRLLRVPVSQGATLQASLGMVLVPLVPELVDAAFRQAAQLFVGQFNQFPAFLPYQAAGWLWRWLVALLGAMLLYQVAKLAIEIGQHRGLYLFRRAARFRLLLVPFMLVAIPAWYSGGGAARPGENPNLYDFSSFAYRLDALLPYLLLPGIFVVIKLINPRDLFQLSPEATSCGALLFGFYLCGQNINLLFVPLPMLLGWYLFRKHLLAKASSGTSWSVPSASTIQALIRLKRLESIAHERQKTADKKFQQADITSIQFEGLQNESSKLLDDAGKSLTATGGSKDTLIFHAGPGSGPLQNAETAVKWGLIFSIPLQFLTLARIMQAPLGDFPFLDLALGVIRSVTIWGLIAFLFGYFFHAIRGADGFQKAVAFSLAVILPTIPQRLITGGDFLDSGHLVEVVQVAAYLLVLAVVAFDVQVLQKANASWRDLPVAYGMGNSVAYVATIVLSVASSFATKELGSLVKSVVQRMLGMGGE